MKENIEKKTETWDEVLLETAGRFMEYTREFFLWHHFFYNIYRIQSSLNKQITTAEDSEEN